MECRPLTRRTTFSWGRWTSARVGGREWVIWSRTRDEQATVADVSVEAAERSERVSLVKGLREELGLGR